MCLSRPIAVTLDLGGVALDYLKIPLTGTIRLFLKLHCSFLTLNQSRKILFLSEKFD